MSANPVILWFRQDLRLTDNPALCAAAASGQVLPVYILDDDNAGAAAMGAASRWWLHQSLTRLDESLQHGLLIMRGDPGRLLPQLAQEYQARAVFWNRCYEPWRREVDSRLKATLRQQGIECQSFSASLLWEPWELLKSDGSPYRVFTPFYQNACLLRGDPRPLAILRQSPAFVVPKSPRPALAQLALLPCIPWYRSLAEAWQPGEAAAGQRLAQFLRAGLDDYRDGRDFPSRQSVSRLSPHLHFGELSPVQIWTVLRVAAQDGRAEHQIKHFIRELIWREYSHYLLYHFPHMPEQNLQSRFNFFPWQDQDQAFECWTRGQTGFPLVDAGMRELWQTGYMHNRVRMVTASFLVKNLLVHWHHGRDWFWDCLVDADLANNSAGWQWVAGCGVDAAPYFRIFNPLTQSRRFDPDGAYIRRFVPELARLPDRHLHDPSSAPVQVLRDAGVQLDDSYPRALVDLSHSRRRALEAFQQINSRLMID